jgi:hypothetical protein
LSEWALSSSPNSPTTIPHRPALFFFFFTYDYVFRHVM